MSEERDTTERQAGDRCCVVVPEWAVDGEGIDELTRGLELLAHPIRLRLLSVLARAPEPVCVCDLEAVLPVKQPTVSHHLRLLRSAGLVDAERKGLWTFYSVRSPAMAELRERVVRELGHLIPEDGDPAANTLDVVT